MAIPFFSERLSVYPGKRSEPASGSFCYDENRITFYSDRQTAPTRIFMIADTHLSLNDDRGTPFRKYSDRMAKYYQQTRNYKTGEMTTPASSLSEVLNLARKANADLVGLIGDIFSFPSEAAIDWVRQQLSESGIPFFFVAGNHDWHYESMPGTAKELRNEWINKRLLPLYQEKNPLMYAIDINGLRLVVIDNSTYEILPEQLDFFQMQVKSGKPLVLFVHIPLYCPGRSVGYGCGHPEWSWESDKSFPYSGLPRWPREGHSKATMDFHQAVFKAPNLMALFAGHVHKQSMDLFHGIPQFTAGANLDGSFLDITFKPLK